MDLVQSDFGTSRIQCSDIKDKSLVMFLPAKLAFKFLVTMTEPQQVLMRTVPSPKLCETLSFLLLVFRFLSPFILPETRFSKAWLSLGNFIEGDNVGRFLVKLNLKFDFFMKWKVLITVHKILPTFRIFVLILLIKHGWEWVKGTEMEKTKIKNSAL